MRYRNLQITIALASIYLLPYRYFLIAVPLFVLPDVVIRTLEALFPPTAQRPDVSGRRRRELVRIFLAGGVLLLASGIVNGIAPIDVVLSIAAYCFPVAALAVFGCLTRQHWQRFLHANAAFVYLQIAFLVFQWVTQSGSSDDWFRGSMLEDENTQIVAFVFFLNTWMFFGEYRRSGRHLYAALISLACAVATNTHLMTFAFLLSAVAYIALRRQFRTLTAGAFLTLLLAFFGPRLINRITVFGTGGVEDVVAMVMANPTQLLRIGKIHGVVFGIQHFADSPVHFLFGQGPGTMASRLIYYKLEASRTTLSFLGPRGPLFEDFTAGLFMGSNLQRPFSNISAFLLEGGFTLSLFMVFLITVKFRKVLWQSHEGRALFVFLVATLFVDHVMDNVKMNFLLVIWLLYLERAASDRDSLPQSKTPNGGGAPIPHLAGP